MSKIYIIGGANIDIFAKSEKEIIPKDSNPSLITFSYGGVGRNICENLTNFEIKPVFISAFGNDEFSRVMINDLEKRGVDLSYSIISNDHSSSIYLAFMDKEDLYVGASDMNVLNLITIDSLTRLKDVINDDDYVLFDTNLKEELIGYIANNLKGIKVVDAISASKVLKLKGALNRIDILKVNKLEAEKLLGKCLEKHELDKGVKAIQDLGVKEVILSDGSDIFLTKDRVYHYMHFAYRENPLNVTGAGDALLAGYVYGRFNKLSLDETVKFAVSCAILTVDDNNAVARLNIENIKTFISQTRIEQV